MGLDFAKWKKEGKTNLIVFGNILRDVIFDFFFKNKPLKEHTLTDRKVFTKHTSNVEINVCRLIDINNLLQMNTCIHLPCYRLKIMISYSDGRNKYKNVGTW